MTNKKIILVRHGNTFGPGDIPTRVGARTDLDLVAKGIEQGRAAGRLIADTITSSVDRVFTSELKRTQQTADAILESVTLVGDRTEDKRFNEVDYGPDENQPEEKVIARIGQSAIDAWDKNAVVPEGWLIDPEKVLGDLKQFLHDIVHDESSNTALVVTSNGIARFFVDLISNQDEVRSKGIKISTGAVCLLEWAENAWFATSWNMKHKL